MRIRSCRGDSAKATQKTTKPKSKHLASTDAAKAPTNKRNKSVHQAARSTNHVCNICDKSFSYSNDLRKHLRIHSDERPFECNHCGLRFRQAGCLKNHVASQHGSAVSYVCHYCTKAFPIKERLRLHMRIHSGEKPYKCEYCAKGFSRGGQVGGIFDRYFSKSI